MGTSEMRRPGRGEISVGSNTYYLSGFGDGSRLSGVAVGISSKPQPFVVEVTSVDECTMRVRMKHTLEFIFVVAGYTPSNMCEAAKKDEVYGKLVILLDRFPFWGHSHCLRRL